MSSRWRGSIVVVGAVLAVATAGCGNSADRDAAPIPAASDSTTAPAARAYVTEVNALCAQLLSDVLAFDIGNDPSIEQFERKRTKLTALIKEFDAKVEATPVTSADRSAAAAFKAYQRFSDAADARLSAAAATGDQEKFDAANEAFLTAVHADPPELVEMHAAGIYCNAR
jgi:hypothetical protein